MKALFPGSFDPFTIGHADILRRILPLFDSVVVGIGVNEGKRALATPLERKRTIEQIFKDEPKVSVETYSDLTADFAQRIGADYIVRGLRSERDYDYERELAAVNRRLGAPEHLFVMARPELAAISSSAVRELIDFGHDVSQFLP